MKNYEVFIINGIEFDTKIWVEVYEGLNLVYEKGLIIEFFKWFDELMTYLYRYGRPEFNDDNWIDEKINEKINELLEEKE